MVAFKDPTPIEMGDHEIIDFADHLRQACGHATGRTLRGLITRLGGSLNLPGVELALGPYILAEGADNRFLIRTENYLSVESRVLNEAIALAHYVIHRREAECGAGYLLVMSPSRTDSEPLLECRRQARLFATSFLAPRNEVLSLLEAGGDARGLAEQCLIPIEAAEEVILRVAAEDSNSPANEI